MGSSSHLKRLNMPRTWPLPRKTTVWITRPSPGGHRLEMCMPIGLVLRDVLGISTSMRESKLILSSRKILVDGNIVRDHRRGVGLMDVLTIGDQHYRCVFDHRGRLDYRLIPAKDATWKICRIEGKSTISGGKTQLNLHDGRNILVDDASEHSSGDSLRIKVPSQEIEEHIPLSEGTRCLIIGGTHAGNFADVNEITIKRSSQPNEVQFSDYGTHLRHVFVVANSDLPNLEVSN